MKNATNEKINLVAAELVKALVQDFKAGNWSSQTFQADKAKIKYPTNVECVKMTVRKDLAVVRRAVQDRLGIDVMPIVKNEEPFNALANRMCRLIKKASKQPGLEALAELGYTK